MDIESLARRWREESRSLRQRGADAQAALLESCATELEEHERLVSLEALTLEDAVQESGFSYAALQKMVATGRIENVGRRYRPRVRRGDLPRKGNKPSLIQAEPDLAARVLAS